MLSLRGLPVYYLDGSGAVAIGEINDSRILKEFYQDFSLIIRLYQLVRMKVKIEELPPRFTRGFTPDSYGKHWAGVW